MNITSTQFRPHQPANKCEAKSNGPTDAPSTTFSSLNEDNIAIGITALTTVGAASLGSVATAQLAPAGTILPKGMTGVTGALAGVAIGAVAGGAMGYGMNRANEILDTKHHHPPIMRLAATVMGGVVGGIAGGVAGYFGADSLLVAPVAVGAGTVGLAGGMLATDAMGLDS